MQPLDRVVRASNFREDRWRRVSRAVCTVGLASAAAVAVYASYAWWTSEPEVQCSDSQQADACDLQSDNNAGAPQCLPLDSLATLLSWRPPVTRRAPDTRRTRCHLRTRGSSIDATDKVAHRPGFWSTSPHAGTCRGADGGIWRDDDEFCQTYNAPLQRPLRSLPQREVAGGHRPTGALSDHHHRPPAAAACGASTAGRVKGGATSSAAPSGVPRPRLLVCHDMRNNYGPDRWPQGGQDAGFFGLRDWSAVDVFVYFSHHMVTVPPPTWIAAAHRHGVQVLGTFITEGLLGTARCVELLATPARARAAAEQLVALAMYFGFEGWLINIENLVPPFPVANLLHFLSHLRCRMHAEVPDALVIWYDAVTVNGFLSHQNSLTPKNQAFFDAADALFVNYHWDANTPAEVAAAAGGRAADVFLGVDVFGRGTYGGGQDACPIALSAARAAGLSAAMFGPGWVFENFPKEAYPAKQERFWAQIVAAWSTRALTCSLPFTTSFDVGCGEGVWLQGRQVSDALWHNLTCQELQPSCSVEDLHPEASSHDASRTLVSPRDLVVITRRVAYNGGACLAVTAPSSSTKSSTCSSTASAAASPVATTTAATAAGNDLHASSCDSSGGVPVGRDMESLEAVATAIASDGDVYVRRLFDVDIVVPPGGLDVSYVAAQLCPEAGLALVLWFKRSGCSTGVPSAVAAAATTAMAKAHGTHQAGEPEFCAGTSKPGRVEHPTERSLSPAVDGAVMLRAGLIEREIERQRGGGWAPPETSPDAAAEAAAAQMTAAATGGDARQAHFRGDSDNVSRTSGSPGPGCGGSSSGDSSSGASGGGKAAAAREVELLAFLDPQQCWPPARASILLSLQEAASGSVSVSGRQEAASSNHADSHHQRPRCRLSDHHDATQPASHAQQHKPTTTQQQQQQHSHLHHDHGLPTQQHHRRHHDVVAGRPHHHQHHHQHDEHQHQHHLHFDAVAKVVCSSRPTHHRDTLPASPTLCLTSPRRPATVSRLLSLPVPHRPPSPPPTLPRNRPAPLQRTLTAPAAAVVSSVEQQDDDRCNGDAAVVDSPSPASLSEQAGPDGGSTAAAAPVAPHPSTAAWVGNASEGQQPNAAPWRVCCAHVAREAAPGDVLIGVGVMSWRTAPRQATEGGPSNLLGHLSISEPGQQRTIAPLGPVNCNSLSWERATSASDTASTSDGLPPNAPPSVLPSRAHHPPAPAHAGSRSACGVQPSVPPPVPPSTPTDQLAHGRRWISPCDTASTPSTVATPTAVAVSPSAVATPWLVSCELRWRPLFDAAGRPRHRMYHVWASFDPPIQPPASPTAVPSAVLPVSPAVLPVPHDVTPTIIKRSMSCAASLSTAKSPQRQQQQQQAGRHLRTARSDACSIMLPIAGHSTAPLGGLTAVAEHVPPAHDDGRDVSGTPAAAAANSKKGTAGGTPPSQRVIQTLAGHQAVAAGVQRPMLVVAGGVSHGSPLTVVSRRSWEGGHVGRPKAAAFAAADVDATARVSRRSWEGGPAGSLSAITAAVGQAAAASGATAAAAVRPAAQAVLPATSMQVSAGAAGDAADGVVWARGDARTGTRRERQTPATAAAKSAGTTTAATSAATSADAMSSAATSATTPAAAAKPLAVCKDAAPEESERGGSGALELCHAGTNRADRRHGAAVSTGARGALRMDDAAGGHAVLARDTARPATDAAQLRGAAGGGAVPVRGVVPPGVVPPVEVGCEGDGSVGSSAAPPSVQPSVVWLGRALAACFRVVRLQVPDGCRSVTFLVQAVGVHGEVQPIQHAQVCGTGLRDLVPQQYPHSTEPSMSQAREIVQRLEQMAVRDMAPDQCAPFS